MAKTERVARKKLSKKQTDVFKPLVSLGTEDDPCFGKHYDPKDSVCQRCGDSELCAIMMGQNNHIQRAKEEQKHTFKDLENPDKIPLDEAKKLAKKRLIELIKKSPNKEKTYLVNEVYTIYFQYGINKKKIEAMIEGLITRGRVSINSKNILSWN